MLHKRHCVDGGRRRLRARVAGSNHRCRCRCRHRRRLCRRQRRGVGRQRRHASSNGTGSGVANYAIAGAIGGARYRQRRRDVVFGHGRILWNGGLNAFDR